MNMRRILFLVFSSLFSLPLAAQIDVNNLFIEFTIKDEDNGKRLAGASVKVFQDGVLLNQLTTDKNARFDLYLDYNHEFTVEISKENYVTKKVYYNTHNVPLEEQDWPHEFGMTIIEMLRELEGLDYSVLEQPISKMYYNANSGSFDYDQVYTKQIQKELQRLESEYKAKQRQEAAMAAAEDKEYTLAMNDAELAMADGDYLTAKENYLAALSIKPGASAPQAKLDEIEKKLSAEAGKDERYLSLLATADQLYGQKKYGEAKAKYQEASTVKPTEKYPKDRIAECDAGIAAVKAATEAEAKLAESERKYRAEVAKAEAELTAGNYQNAKTYFANALSIKADEPYPKEQIAAIDNKLKELAAKAEADKKAAEVLARYQAQIDKADVAFNGGNYENARTLYKAAKEIKPDESYPDAQLALIDERVTNLAAKAAEEEARAKAEQAYRTAVAAADKAFTANDLATAKTRYQEALDQRPDDKYARERVEECDRQLADLAARQKADAALGEQYAALIKQGDDAFKGNDLDAASVAFKQASELKPAEKYPKDQLALIEKRRTQLADAERKAAQQQEREARFNKLIADADAAYQADELDKAKQLYNEAVVLNPAIAYPKDQLTKVANRQRELDELARIQADASKRDANYQTMISEADAYLAKDDLDNARRSYRLAAGIKPDESYPNEQIAAIEKKIAEQEALARAEAEEKKRQEEAAAEQKKFDEALRLAQGYMDAEDYVKAREQYAEANRIKPGEAGPKSKLDEIDQLLLAMRQAQTEAENKRQSYNDFLRTGDQAVLAKDWNAAREAFQSALLIYPEEAVPQSRLKEIDLLEQKELDDKIQQEFGRLVVEADKAFLDQRYTDAREAYTRALDLIADNAHAKARIQKIDEILSRQTATATNEDKAVERRIEEEQYEENRSTVTIRRVIVGDKVDVYKRIVYSWGGKYYFLNDNPISEVIWQKDTTK